jgi:hypothetical protein
MDLVGVPARVSPNRPSRAGSRSARWRRPGIVALLAAALLSTVAGAWLILDLTHRPPAPAGRTATVGGITTQVQPGGWLAMAPHTMDGQGGYQMPSQMMPGAPEGDQLRLGIPVVLSNPTGLARQFDLLDEFVLVGGATTAPVPLHSDTFGTLNRLNPGAGVSGVLYFDTTVPGQSDPPLQLRWTRAGRTVNLTVPIGGATPAPHQHGP